MESVRTKETQYRFLEPSQYYWTPSSRRHPKKVGTVETEEAE